MELSEEHLEKIEKEAKMFCQQNGIKYPKSYYPGTKIVVKHLIKFVLSDPELLSKAGWVKKEEVFQFIDGLRNYERESGGKLCFDERTSEQMWDIYVGLIDADLNPLPSPPQNK